VVAKRNRIGSKNRAFRQYGWPPAAAQGGGE